MGIVFKRKLSEAPVKQVEMSPPAGQSGRDVIKGLIRASVAQRHAMRRMGGVPRLSRSAELDAIAAFKASKGVTVCPTVHLVASEQAVAGRGGLANTLMRDRLKAAGL